MEQDKKWMLMTYYCPIYGEAGRIEPLEISREQTSKTFFKKRKTKKHKRV